MKPQLRHADRLQKMLPAKLAVPSAPNVRQRMLRVRDTAPRASRARPSANDCRISEAKTWYGDKYLPYAYSGLSCVPQLEQPAWSMAPRGETFLPGVVADLLSKPRLTDLIARSNISLPAREGCCSHRLLLSTLFSIRPGDKRLLRHWSMSCMLRSLGALRTARAVSQAIRDIDEQSRKSVETVHRRSACHCMPLHDTTGILRKL
eukprot:4557155-Pleurochrysis_carterae.AAC.2